MFDGASDAVRFASGRTRADLDRDAMLAFAITRALQIVGEASIKVSDETRNLLPQVQWSAIAGMRNRLVHAYFDVNLDIVWDTLELDLPPLIAALAAYLARED